MTHQEVRDLRKAVDTVIFAIEGYMSLDAGFRPDAREMSLARTKFQEGKMWLGQALGARGNDSYPQELRDHCDERSA